MPNQIVKYSTTAIKTALSNSPEYATMAIVTAGSMLMSIKDSPEWTIALTFIGIQLSGLMEFSDVFVKWQSKYKEPEAFIDAEGFRKKTSILTKSCFSLMWDRRQPGNYSKKLSNPFLFVVLQGLGLIAYAVVASQETGKEEFPSDSQILVAAAVVIPTVIKKIQSWYLGVESKQALMSRVNRLEDRLKASERIRLTADAAGQGRSTRVRQSLEDTILDDRKDREVDATLS